MRGDLELCLKVQIISLVAALLGMTVEATHGH